MTASFEAALKAGEINGLPTINRAKATLGYNAQEAFENYRAVAHFAEALGAPLVELARFVQLVMKEKYPKVEKSLVLTKAILEQERLWKRREQ